MEISHGRRERRSSPALKGGDSAPRDLVNAAQTQNNPSKPFVSPFSYRQGYNLTWFKIDPRWRGVPNALGEVTERVKKVAELTESTKIISKYQLIRHFFTEQSAANATKYLNKINRAGLLIRHVLSNSGRDLVVYTLGPLGAQLIKVPFAPNWWLDLQKTPVLKQLIANQLFLRLIKTGDAKYMVAPYPFTGVLTYKGIEFPMIAVRGDVEDINRELRHTNFQRGFIICEDVKQIEQVAPNVIHPARYTTDYDILYTPLNEAFYTWSPDGGVERERLSIFPERI